MTGVVQPIFQARLPSVAASLQQRVGDGLDVVGGELGGGPHPVTQIAEKAAGEPA